MRDTAAEAGALHEGESKGELGGLGEGRLLQPSQPLYHWILSVSPSAFLFSLTYFRILFVGMMPAIVVQIAVTYLFKSSDSKFYAMELLTMFMGEFDKPFSTKLRVLFV